MERLIKTLGKSKEALAEEALASEKKDNPANFGKGRDTNNGCSFRRFKTFIYWFLFYMTLVFS